MGNPVLINTGQKQVTLHEDPTTFLWPSECLVKDDMFQIKSVTKSKTYCMSNKIFL